MNFKNYYYSAILEMQERFADSNGTYIIAFQGYIWRLGDEKLPDNIKNDIIEKTGLSEELAEDLETAIDFSSITEVRKDIFYGYITNDNYLNISYDIEKYGQFSLLVKRIISFYNLDGVKIENPYNDEMVISKWSLGETGYTSFAYHGTTVSAMRNILKKGLIGNTEGNWKFKFPDRIFLTNRIDYAIFHARSAAYRNKSYPIVLKVKIPDKSLITYDYDVARAYLKDEEDTENYAPHFNRPSYELKNIEDIKKNSPKTNFLKESGVFAYKGRIPPSFFLKMYYSSYYLDNDWHEHLFLSELLDTNSLAEMKKIIEQLDEHGMVFDENEYEEENEDEI